MLTKDNQFSFGRMCRYTTVSVELEQQENEISPQQEPDPRGIEVIMEMVRLWNYDENSDEVDRIHDKLFSLVRSMWSEAYSPPFCGCHASFTATHELDNTMFADYRVFVEETRPCSILLWINDSEERANCSVKEIQL